MRRLWFDHRHDKPRRPYKTNEKKEIRLIFIIKIKKYMKREGVKK